MFVFTQLRNKKIQWYMIENKRHEGKMIQRREYLFTTEMPERCGKIQQSTFGLNFIL